MLGKFISRASNETLSISLGAVVNQWFLGMHLHNGDKSEKAVDPALYFSNATPSSMSPTQHLAQARI